MFSVLVFGLLAASCGSSNGARTATSTTTTSTTEVGSTTSSTTTTRPGVVPAIGLKSYVTSVQSPSLVANISYPVLGGMASGQIQGNINAAISKAVTGYVSSFQTRLEGQSTTTLPPGVGNGVTQSQISGSFIKELVDPRYVSFKFLITTYAAGAASPTTEAACLTFDLSNGQLLTLSDLFSGSSYLPALSSMAKTAVSTKLGQAGDQNLINGGTQPNAGNFSNWNLTANGLELTFSQGLVAAAAAGVVSVVLPYSGLSKLAKSPGPLTNP